MLTLDLKTARRFILGKQGLWTGRRWRGMSGTQQAMRAMEYLQLDRFRSLPILSTAVLTGHVVTSVIRNLLSTYC